MTRPLVLVVSRHDARLVGHESTIRGAGPWWVLPAPTVERATELLRKVRPALVLYDADGDGEDDADGALPALHRALHDRAPHAEAHLTVLGPVAPAAEATLSRVADAACPHCARCPHCGRAYPDATGTALLALLGHILSAAGAVTADGNAADTADSADTADAADHTPGAVPAPRDGKRAP